MWWIKTQTTLTQNQIAIFFRYISTRNKSLKAFVAFLMSFGESGIHIELQLGTLLEMKYRVIYHIIISDETHNM